jgi:hypothetical protein
VNLDRFIVRVPFQVIFLHEPLFLNGPIYGEQVTTDQAERRAAALNMLKNGYSTYFLVF